MTRKPASSPLLSSPWREQSPPPLLPLLPCVSFRHQWLIQVCRSTDGYQICYVHPSPPVFTAPRWLQPLVVPFTADRVERLRRDGQVKELIEHVTQGVYKSRGLCGHLLLFCDWGTWRAAIFETWLCMESLWVVLSVYDRMVICGAAL